MPEKWTADLIGKMHLNNITAKQLAEHLNLNPKYVSTVLNGHRNPKKAKSIFNAALEEILKERM